jgi:hypothetical protein
MGIVIPLASRLWDGSSADRPSFHHQRRKAGGCCPARPPDVDGLPGADLVISVSDRSKPKATGGTRMGQFARPIPRRVVLHFIGTRTQRRCREDNVQFLESGPRSGKSASLSLWPSGAGSKHRRGWLRRAGADRVKELFKKDEKANLAALRHQSTLKAGLEAALFGRMITSDRDANTDAAVHVAHAFTVHQDTSR